MNCEMLRSAIGEVSLVFNRKNLCSAIVRVNSRGAKGRMGEIKRHTYRLGGSCFLRARVRSIGSKGSNEAAVWREDWVDIDGESSMGPE